MFRILILLLLSQSLFAQMYDLVHKPVDKYSLNYPVRIEAIFSGEASVVSEALLLAKPANQSVYKEYPMTLEGVIWEAEIQETDLTEFGLEYIIVFNLYNMGIVTSPGNNPYQNPYSVEYIQKEPEHIIKEDLIVKTGVVESDIMILSPEPGSKILSQDLVITLSLFNVPDADLGSVKLFIDNQNFTRQAEISTEVITLKPPIDLLKPGAHTIELSLANNFGAYFKPITWTFELVTNIKEVEEIFGANGRISMEYRNERLESTTNNLFRTKLNITGSASTVNYGININWVDNESPLYQPRNNYGFFIKSKYLDMNFGDSFPLFTRLGLWGNRLRGVDVSVKFGLINVQFINGSLLRNINGKSTYTDSLQHYTISNYTYGRNVMGIRPSFGKGEKFNFYISLMKTRDDTTSINPPLFIEDYDPDVHNYTLSGSKPKDNLIIGMGNSLYLDSRHLIWFQDVALSLTNQDINGGFIDTIAFGDTSIAFSQILEQANLPLSPELLSSIFIVNRNTSIPIPASLDEDLALSFQPFALGKYPTLAYSSILQLDYYNNYVNINYRRIAPEFNSLANSGIMNDSKTFEINDRIRLLSNKLFLTAKYSTQRDNLLEGIKQFTTTSKTTSFGFNLMPGQGLPTANLNMKLYNRFNDASEVDTLFVTYTDPEGNLIEEYNFNDQRVNNQTTFQMININQPFKFFNLRNSANFSYIQSFREDLIKNRPSTYLDMSMSMKVFNITAITYFTDYVKQSVSFSQTRNKTGALLEYNYDIYGLKYDASFFEKKLQFTSNLKRTHAFGIIEFVQYSAALDTRIKIFENQLLFTVLFNKIQQEKGDGQTLKFFTKYSYSF